MKRLMSLVIVAVLCLAATPKSKTIIVHGQEIQLGKRICGAPPPAIEVVITGVYDAELVPSEASCKVVRGYMIPHLADKHHQVTISVTEVYSSTTGPYRSGTYIKRTSKGAERKYVFMRPKPDKRHPWAVWFEGGMTKKGAQAMRVIVNTSFRETSDLE